MEYLVKRYLFSAVAALMLLVGFAAPANAAIPDIERGHTQVFDTHNVLYSDYQTFADWSTSYNSVGTSSTEPRDFNAATNSIKLKKGTKSLKITFKTAAGTIHGSHTYNCTLPDVGWCYYPSFAGTFAAGDFSNILLSEGPRLVLAWYSGTNATGSITASGTYAYK
jgi:hypothetical protein